MGIPVAIDIRDIGRYSQQNECAPIKNSGQTGYPPSLTRVSTVRIKKHDSSATIKCVTKTDLTVLFLKLIRVFAGSLINKLILSCSGSINYE